MENTIVNDLRERKKEVEEIIALARKDLKNAPEGRLRISEGKKRGTAQFFLCRDDLAEKYPKGKYICKSNLALPERLAQKQYAESVLKTAETELRSIEYMLDQYSEFEANQYESLYSSLHPERKKLIQPYDFDNIAYAKKWMAQPYNGKRFREGDPVHYSARGERVRSKSEKLIANELLNLGIPYKYECPLELKGGRTIIHPDFTLLNVYTLQEAYLEHFGMLDDPEYLEKALARIDDYEEDGYFSGKSLFITRETSNKPYDERKLKSLLSDFIPVRKPVFPQVTWATA